MRTALLRTPRGGGNAGIAARGQRSRVYPLPAPTGGWNARDALTAMGPNDAIVLDNFIPDIGGVRLRNGYDSHGTGLNGVVESLMEYAPPSGSNVLFAATDDTIYNATTAGAASSSLASLSNGRWQHAMMATSGGNFLVIANGEDSVRHYNGSAWATPAITVGTSSTFITVTVHQSRLWFAQKDTLKAWYLPSSAVAGAATEFDIGPLCKKGGYLQAIASWSRDGGAGIDDMLVFITSKGEVLVYGGLDPDDPTFQKVGTFQIPEPIGRRCVVTVGADLGVITSVGVLPFSKILPMPGALQAQAAATDKIVNAFKTAYRRAAAVFGWQVVQYPKGNIALINVPVTAGTEFHQFVMNTNTGAWCRFTDIPATCWCLLGDDLYFGGDGVVYKYSTTGFTDAGSMINPTAIGAFSNLGAPSNKQVVQVRPMITGPDGYVPGLAILTDYDTNDPTYTPVVQGSPGTAWDTALWDTVAWGLPAVNSNEWLSVEGSGSVVAFAINAPISENLEYNAVDLMLFDGGYTQ